ncbi:MAG: fused response regulator/phosphatase [Nitrospirota bacterium]
MSDGRVQDESLQATCRAGAWEGGGTIVVADDDAVSRTATAAKLRRLGHQVHEAADGAEALALITQLKPDLAVLDWIMPGFDGPSVCEAVRREPELKSCQLILLTALDQPDQLVEGLARGADDFLSKSATTQELLARIKAGLRSSRLVRQVEAANRDLQDELRAASAYVQTLLPRPGFVGCHVRCDWKYIPSLALGGDLFLVHPDSDWVALAMFDASGHGVSAALRAAAFAAFLRERWRTQPNAVMVPHLVVEEASRVFPLSAEGFYFTVWLGGWDVRSGRLVWASAGHSGALLVRDGGFEWLAFPSLPLGFVPGEPCPVAETRIGSGERLVLVSDGLYEARDASGTVWGRHRLGESAFTHRHATLDQFVARVVEAARAWMPSDMFPDDVAVFAAEAVHEHTVSG